MIKQGWYWLDGTQRMHYFERKESLCRKYTLDTAAKYGNQFDQSEDNCGVCRKKLRLLKDLERYAPWNNNS